MARRTSLPRLLLLPLLLPLLLLPAACRGTGRGGVHASERAHEPPARSYDVQHYALDIVLQPETESLEAVARVRFVPTVDGLSRVELDFGELEVESVRDGDGRDLAHEHAQGLLTIELAEPLSPGTVGEVEVAYSGSPTEGLYFSGVRTDGSGPTQVFTQGEAEHSQGWFPCFDHPSDRATSEVRVTMPSGWVSMAPGERIDVVEGEAERTEHWRMTTPHPCYLVSLVAGELVVHEAEWDGTPLYFLAEPEYEDWMEASFHETDEILGFLSDYTGVRYPYAKYSQAAVANFPWGGMENISATTLTPLTFDDERGNRDQQSTELVAHEAAHQWFGDLVTCEDWSHLWLNEGFATYLTLLYFEETRGVDEFRALVRQAQQRYLEEDRGSARRPTVWNVYKEPDDLFDTRAYEGAAARLHLLRFVVGDEAFRAGVRTYLAENAARSVDTEDLRSAMEKVSGQDLEWFFDQWLYGPGYPEFRLEWEWDEEEETVVLSINQEQGIGDRTPSAFRTPVDVEIRDQGGTAVHRIEITRRSQRFELAASKRPTYVRFDKYGWIPKGITWRRSPSEWLAIASSDDDVNGRFDAVRALGELARTEAAKNPDAHATFVSALANRLRRDDSPWVRAAAAEALGRAGGREAEMRLVTAAQEDPEAAVRVASLEALGAWGRSPELAALGRAVFEEGYSWATCGAAAGLVCVADPESAYAWLSEKLFLDSPHDQLCAHLLIHLGRLPNPGVSEQLRRWAADDAVHPTARGVALRALALRTEERPENSRFIAGFLEAKNFRLSAAAVEALAVYDDDRSMRTLEGFYEKARTSDERRAIEAAVNRRGR